MHVKPRKLLSTLLALVMVFGMFTAMPLSASAASPLATPVLIQKGANTDTPGSPGNPASHTQYRSLIFERIAGATGYNVYAYGSKADAEADKDCVAVAYNVQPTIESISTGGTMAQSPMTLVGDEVLIDVRLVTTFEGDAVREKPLPADFTPAGIGDSYLPGDGTGDKTNLKPGQYWFRLQATDAADKSKDSGKSLIYADGDAFSIAAGPDEARTMIEECIAKGMKPGVDFRIIDVRSLPEYGDEGYIRFSERFPVGELNTVEKAEALLGANKDILIFEYCRGGGRSVTAARHLSNAGYTNVINMQGVVQWTNGLMYNDETFRFRAIETGVDGEASPGTNADSPAGISLDNDACLLRWYNLPRAKYNVYAFDSAEETDPAKAIANGSLAALPQVTNGTSADWRLARVFDLTKLDLTIGDTYYIRVQALPEVDIAVKGYEPSTIWGAPSKLSDPVTWVAAEPAAEFPFTDVKETDWYYGAVKAAWETGLINGKTPSAFVPGGNLTYAEAVKLAACMHQLYTTGEVTLEGGSPWYQSYVDYAKEKNIISGDYEWNAPATRAGYMAIFANALPEDAFQAINDIEDGAIPDVAADHQQAAAIYALYRAGIIQGVDSAHNCSPDSNIKRGEVATIIIRMMNEDERVEFSI